MYPPFPPVFQLGALSIHWYGIFIVTAICVGALLASQYLTWRGQDGKTIWSLLLWIAIPALLGARLSDVFTRSADNPAGSFYYLAHPLEILAIWQGNIHLYGALIGGCIALLLYTFARKLPALIYLDAIAFALPLSQAIGRLASFINQEWYGLPTTLPWGVRIDPAYRVAPFDNLTRYPENGLFQPLFLYEILWNLIGFALIFYLAQRLAKKLRAGSILLLYLTWYSLGRFCLEFLHPDTIPFPHIPFDLVQLLSAFVALASLILLLARPRRRITQPAAFQFAAAGSAGQLKEEESESVEGIDLVVEYTFWQRYQSFLAGQDNQLEYEESEGIEDMEENVEWNEPHPFAAMALEEIGENVEEEASTEEDEEIEEVLEEKEAEIEEESEDEDGEDEEAEEVIEEESEDEESAEEEVECAEEGVEENEYEAVEEIAENAEEDATGDEDAECAEDDSEGSDDGDAGDASDE